MKPETIKALTLHFLEYAEDMMINVGDEDFSKFEELVPDGLERNQILDGVGGDTRAYAFDFEVCRWLISHLTEEWL